MAEMTRTPDHVQRTLREMLTFEDIIDTAELDVMIEYARKFLPEITDQPDWDTSWVKITETNIYGAQYVPGPQMTIWGPGSTLGVMISTDTLTPTGEHYSNGYTSVVSW